jgi:molybdopterin synthase sulfur carrier subunit
MVVVKLFGGLRRAAGMPTLTMDGDTVRAVLNRLCADNAKLRTAILDGDELQPHVRVIVNGRDIELEQGLDMPLDADAAIFPPIAGGAE